MVQDIFTEFLETSQLTHNDQKKSGLYLLLFMYDFIGKVYNRKVCLCEKAC